jgi:hypothetical protein
VSGGGTGGGTGGATTRCSTLLFASARPSVATGIEQLLLTQHSIARAVAPTCAADMSAALKEHGPRGVVLSTGHAGTVCGHVVCVYCAV